MLKMWFWDSRYRLRGKARSLEFSKRVWEQAVIGSYEAGRLRKKRKRARAGSY